MIRDNHKQFMEDTMTWIMIIPRRWPMGGLALKSLRLLFATSLMGLLFFLSLTQVCMGQVDPDQFIPGRAQKFVGERSESNTFKEERPWYEQLQIQEDAKKYSSSKTLRLRPPTYYEKLRSKTAGQSFISRELVNPKLTWEYTGIRDWYGDKYHTWITAIEFPGALNISLYFLKIETNGMLFMFGNKETLSDLEKGHVYHSPRRPDINGNTFAGVFKGNIVYVIYYNQDQQKSPTLYPPFATTGIRIKIFNTISSAIINNLLVASYSLDA